MMKAFAALFASRKSIVGAVGVVLIGLIYFFGEGDWASKSTAMGTVAGIIIAIITAIGREDAAEKGKNVTVTSVSSEAKQ